MKGRVGMRNGEKFREGWKAELGWRKREGAEMQPCYKVWLEPHSASQWLQSYRLDTSDMQYGAAPIPNVSMKSQHGFPHHPQYHHDHLSHELTSVHLILGCMSGGQVCVCTTGSKQQSNQELLLSLPLFKTFFSHFLESTIHNGIKKFE